DGLSWRRSDQMSAGFACQQLLQLLEFHLPRGAGEDPGPGQVGPGQGHCCSRVVRSGFRGQLSLQGAGAGGSAHYFWATLARPGGRFAPQMTSEVGYVIDGSEKGLPAAPRELYESGRVNPAKVYLNHGADEGTVFALIMYAAYPWYEAPSLSHAATDDIMKWAFNSSVAELYPHGSGSSAPFYRMSRAISDSTFVCPHRRFATALSKQRPNSVFYAETPFAGGDLHDSNWLTAVIH
ncbi:ache, partial [Symbiodinium pilosum]